MSIFNVTDAVYFATVSAAIAASSAGDVIQISAGTYVEEFPLITHSLTLQGVGGMAHLMTPTRSRPMCGRSCTCRATPAPT